MKLRNALTIAAFASAIFGLGLYFAPTFFLQQNGVDTNAAALFLARTAGASFLGVALVNWMARVDLESLATRGVAYGNILAHALGLVGDVMATNSGVITKNSWLGISAHIVIIALFAYALMDSKKR